MLLLAVVAALLIVNGLKTYELGALSVGLQTTPRKQCDFPIVYNKPPKTASSFLQMTIKDWAESENRSNYICSKDPRYTNLRLQECISPEPDSCGILNCHMYLDANARRVLDQRLPGNLLLTSTRYPPHRIVSFYLQIHDKKYNDDIWKGLGYYLNRYEVWRFYNYHTGENRMGSCPLNDHERVLISTLAARYDIVVDANLRDISNTILGYFGLFELPIVKGERNKDRGAYKLTLPDDVKQKLRNLTCVEEELHRAFQLRMASLYELASGKKCITANGNCIEKGEYEALKSNWIF